MATKTKKTMAKTESAKKSFPVLGVVFGGIALLLVAAIVFSPSESIGSAGEYGDPVISGSSLPPMTGGASVVESDEAIGLDAPEVEGQDFDDSTVKIENDGTAKAIVFLAHWCSHCQAEVPRVQSWLDATGGVPGVQLMSVTTSASSGQQNWPPSEWMERENWSSPNIRDDSDSSVLRAYGGSSFPYWVFLNSDGTVAFRMSGETDITTLETIMESLN
ncbi:MAG: TlpA family protein disulfide reductase [bacterium]|nr:TlpA family protein disulfide reductase [bacterium]